MIIRASIERHSLEKVCVYRKPDSGWSIVVIRLADGRTATAKGVIEFEPKHGDPLELDGEWTVSNFPGSMGKQEFIFKSAMLSIPSDPRTLLHYACQITKGIGPVKEAEIWERYGTDWQNQQSLDVRGITESTQWAWRDTLDRLKDQNLQTQAMAYLLSKGCSMNMANAAWKRWESNTIRVVEDDCYMLTDLPHYGFGHVDESIRVAFGITNEDPRRVRAAILYVMSEVLDGGDTVAAWADVANRVAGMVPGALKQMDSAIKELVRLEKVVVLHGELLAMKKDWENEAKVWGRFDKGEKS